MKFCTNCGTEIGTGIRFCSNCGQTLAIDTVTPQATGDPFNSVKVNVTGGVAPIANVPVQPTAVSYQQPAQSVNPYANQQAYQQGKTAVDAKSNRNATIGFVLGLISWLLSLFGVVPIIAIVFSCLAMSTGVEGRSKVFAMIGIVSGVINIIYVLVVLAGI